MPHDFDYSAAFSRNIGWVTRAEQAALRGKRVAIAGLGGVGGLHLVTMARLGIGAFNLAEFDDFGLVNFNRQCGATLANIGRPKLDVMLEMASEINPALDVRTFPEGVSTTNLDDFLDGVDLYLDGLDFFVLTLRQAVFAACARKGIPATTVAPLGMGAALLNFLPGSMTFEDYFGFGNAPESEKALRFFLGLAPSGLQMGYLVDPSTIDLPGHKGPSTPMGAMLCAGVAGTEALKILLGRGKVYAAPWGVHFDAYKNCLKRTWRPGGHRNPLSRLALNLTRKRLGLPKP
jgi:molybdopterin/thiamine biosynthesis adenylyltransferase